MLPALRAPCYVFSDVHLGAAAPDAERQLRGFLDHRLDDAKSLVINGDLFDFWFEWSTVVPRDGYRVLSRLADVAERGVQVLWIGGNHDCWGARRAGTEAGITYHLGTWRGEIGAWRTRIDHGDGLRDGDRGYRVLRTIVRHPWSIGAFRLLHPDLGVKLARASSHTSRSVSAQDNGVALRSAALRILDAERETRLLILGHSHVAALEGHSTGGIFANAGGWMTDPTYLRIDDSTIALKRYGGANPDQTLTELARR